MSSITDNGTGDYGTNFQTNMANTNYCVVSGSGNDTGSTGYVNRYEAYSRTTASFRATNTAHDTGATYDRAVCYHIVFGD